MIRRLAGAALIAVTSLPAPAAPLHACSAAQQYQITIQRLELKNEAGRWVSVFEPDSRVDLIQQKPAVSFFNNGKIPSGRYVNFRLQISPVIRVSGSDAGYSTLFGGYVVVKAPGEDLSKISRDRWRFEPLADSAAKGPSPQLMKVEFARLTGAPPAQAPMQLSAVRDFEGVGIEKGTFIHLGFLLDFEGTVCYASEPDLARSTVQKPFLYALPPRSATDAVFTVGQTVKTFQPEELTLKLP